MNPTPDQPRHDDPEARVTALLLGELTQVEAEELQAAIAHDPELARLRDRLQETIGLLRAALAQPEVARTEQSEVTRMSEARRETLLRAIRTVPFPTSRPQPGTRVPGSRWYVSMALAALLMVLLGLATLWIPLRSPLRGRELARRGEDKARLTLEAARPSDDETKSRLGEEYYQFRARGLVTNRPVPAGTPPPGNARQPEVARYYDSMTREPAKPMGGVGGGAGLVPAPAPTSSTAGGEQLVRSKALPTITPPSADPVALAPLADLEAVVPGRVGAEPKADSKMVVTSPDANTLAFVLPAQAPATPNHPANRLLMGRDGLDLKLEHTAAPQLQFSERAAAVEFDVAGKSKEKLAPNGSLPMPEQQLGNVLLKNRADADADFGRVESLSVQGSNFGGAQAAGTTAGLGLADTQSRNHFFAEPSATIPSFGDIPELGVALRGEAEVAQEVRKAGADGAARFARPIELKEEAAGRGESIPRGAEADQLAERSKDQLHWQFLRENGTRQLPQAAKEKAGDELALVKKLAEAKSPVLREERQVAPSLEVAAITEADVAVPSAPATPPAEPRPEIVAAHNPFSTFSLNVSDVSFKLAAAALEKGVLPNRASIRSEEFVNALDYRDPLPGSGRPVAFHWERARYPFAHNRDLLRFSVKTAARGREAGRPLNVVLCLDNSGSMERADRVAIIHEALRVLAAQLTPQDRISVVTFSRNARLWVDGLRGDLAGGLADQVGSLTPQGGTNLEDALRLAYETARRHYQAEGVNRVVMLTDGAANLGELDPGHLKQEVESQRRQGIALDCFGIGWEGFNDDLLEALSRNGDGRYGFVNTPLEAATEFAAQLTGALQVAASDVKVQVEFNPRRVAAYRQVGYQKHQLTKEQFRDNTVDAAEIGSAEAGNALYVVAVNPEGQGPIGIARVRYKVPGTTRYEEHEWTLDYTGPAVGLDAAPPSLRLAASAGAFAEWLASNPYAAGITPDALLGLLRGVPEHFGADPRPTRLEWMIRQAKSVSSQ